MKPVSWGLQLRERAVSTAAPRLGILGFVRVLLKLTGPPKLFGRDPDLAVLDDAWAGRRLKVVTLVAWGGVGKTALVHTWRNRLCEHADRPELVFEWSFASQGVRERGAVSADDFLRDALRFFGDVEYAESGASPPEKGTRLAELVGERRALLVLDGIEPLQAPPPAMGASSPLREGSIANLLRGLALSNRGLCVVTTREAVEDLDGFAGSVRRLDLEHLHEEHGAELLQSLLAEGKRPRAVASTPDERAEISRAVHGHALTLQLLGTYIRHALGDVRRWREVDFERVDEEQGGHAFRVMEAYVAWLSRAGLRGQRQLAALRLLGFFERPADPACIAALRARPAIPGVTEALDGLDAQGWAALTASLEQLRLVMRAECAVVSVRGYDEVAARQAGEREPPVGPPKRHRPQDYGPGALVLDAHPLVREFFASELRRTHEAGWREGHRRLYEHLCRSVPHWPEGIEGLQPLYQAVVHGCAAGRTSDVRRDIYWERILRGARFYSRRQLGATSADLAAVACFFESLWDKPSATLEETSQSWVLGEAAACLRALGRPRDALGPLRAGLERVVRQEAWTNAAIAAGNLSALELMLGQISEAVEDAEKSVEYARLSRNDSQRMVKRTVLAHARHQAGDLAGARKLFEEAEIMAARVSPTEPWLHSYRGYCYCALLLQPAERETWRATPVDPAFVDGHVTLCQKVVDRATRALEAARRYNAVVDIALDHLTVGQAALYAAMLFARTPACIARSPELSFAAARTHLAAAVDGLRTTVSLDDLPRALIARAQLNCCDDPKLARRDLDEAWTLAERGPMPLYQADILLTRARLFRDRDDLARARELIDRHGYGRRREELEDAELGALAWPAPGPQLPPDLPPSPRSTPMPTPPWDPSQRPDIAILIALPEEYRTLAADLSDAWYPRPNPDYPGSDFLFIGPGGYRCTATIMPRMGPTVANQVSMRLLGMRPKTIINIGIAGGFKSDDLRIGDVIVPRQVDAYDETGKVEGVKWKRRGSDYRPSADLVAEVQELEFTARSDFSQWVKDGIDQLNALRTGPDNERIEKLLKSNILRTAPLVSTYHLASGSFVVASKPFAEFIREANADIHAGEMEAAGMMAAAEYRREPVRTLVVRGISDHVDADKREVDAVGEGALRRLAMANAWRLVCTLMRLGRLARADAVANVSPTRQTGPTASPSASGTPPPTPQAGPSSTSPSFTALTMWQAKLAYFLEHEPITTDPDAKFRLQHLIAEARAKIRELGGAA